MKEAVKKPQPTGGKPIEPAKKPDSPGGAVLASETVFRNDDPDYEPLSMRLHPTRLRGRTPTESQQEMVKRFDELETAVFGVGYILEETGSMIDEQMNTLAQGPCAWQAGRFLAASLRERFQKLQDAWVESVKGGV